MANILVCAGLALSLIFLSAGICVKDLYKSAVMKLISAFLFFWFVAYAAYFYIAVFYFFGAAGFLIAAFILERFAAPEYETVRLRNEQVLPAAAVCGCLAAAVFFAGDFLQNQPYTPLLPRIGVFADYLKSHYRAFFFAAGAFFFAAAAGFTLINEK